jgi:hypothetical protein
MFQAIDGVSLRETRQGGWAQHGDGGDEDDAEADDHGALLKP